MATALLLGCTGLVGSHILSTLRTSAPQFSSIDIIARRSPPAASESTVPVRDFVEKDSSKWGPLVSSLSPAPSVLFYALGTTRAAAGGFENQYKWEREVSTEVTTAAKAAGVKTFVLISSAGSDPASFFKYPKMKGEIEKQATDSGFDHTIILRPGLIVGERENAQLEEVFLKTVANGLGRVHSALKDPWAQDADTIAKAAVAAAIKAEKGEVKDKVWILGTKDIVRLGAREWKTPSS